MVDQADGPASKRQLILQEVRIRHFGRIKTLDLRLGPSINVILGENASGKTVLLHLLASVIRRHNLSIPFLESGREPFAAEITIKEAPNTYTILAEAIPETGTSSVVRYRSLSGDDPGAHPGDVSPLVFGVQNQINYSRSAVRQAGVFLTELDRTGAWSGFFEQYLNHQPSSSQSFLMRLALEAIERLELSISTPIIIDGLAETLDKSQARLYTDLILRLSEHAQVILAGIALPVPEWEQYVVARLGTHRLTPRLTEAPTDLPQVISGSRKASVFTTEQGAPKDPNAAQPEAPKVEVKANRSVVGGMAAGDGATVNGGVTVQTIHAETVYLVGGDARESSPLHDAPGGLQRRGTPTGGAQPTPHYPDAETRRLSEQLEAARARKLTLKSRGFSTAEVDGEILDLRRRIREGGQLRAGDSFGEGRYLLLEKIGRGGFAVVWKAHDRDNNQMVAIKVLHADVAGDPTRRERFFRGARAMAELQHEAVVRVLEPHGEDGGYHYFVMEFVDGLNLHEAVLAGHITKDDVLPLILRIGEALVEAHAKSMVHRDVKPANILVDQKKCSKLTDFDLVHAADTTGGTRTGALGTFVYAAPEMLDRPQEADARADVYGLGMTAMFALRGAPLPLMVLQQPQQVLVGLPCSEAVREVLGAAIRWDHATRIADAESFCVALRDASENELTPGRRNRVETSSAKGAGLSHTVVVDTPEYALGRFVSRWAKLEAVVAKASMETQSGMRGGSSPFYRNLNALHARGSLTQDQWSRVDRLRKLRHTFIYAQDTASVEDMMTASHEIDRLLLEFARSSDGGLRNPATEAAAELGLTNRGEEH